jgi:hypothetical protein
MIQNRAPSDGARPGPDRRRDPTTQLEPRRRGRAGIVLSLLLGALLCVLAGPRLVGAVVGAPADRVMFYLDRGQPVTDQALRGLVVARQAAVAWRESAQDYRDIGTAALLLAHRGGDRSDYDDAEQALHQGLAMAPLDPHSWARLAHIAVARDRDAPAAIRALRASLQSGAYEPSLDAWRVALMLRLWEAGTVEDRVAFVLPIRQWAREDPDGLAALSADPHARAILADLIGPLQATD